MTTQSVEIWETRKTEPLIWMTTAAIAVVTHLAILQFAISTYQSQVEAPLDDTPVETKIFAAALQVAGTDAPEPEQLSAQPIAPSAPNEQPITLQPSQPVTQTLSATVAEAEVAQAVETLAPVTVEPTSVAPVDAAPEAVELAPLAAPEPEVVTATQAPEIPPPPQPGVAPVTAAPAPVAQAAPVEPTTETLEVATLDAPTVVGTQPAPEPLPEPESSPEPAADPVPVLEPEPAPKPAPLPDLATSLPQPSGPAEDQAGIASANTPEQTTEEAQETYLTVLDFLRGFDGGPCFAALPVLAEDGAFRFETFAQNNGDLNRFRDALEVETGTLPGTVMKPVSDAQCQALPFVTAAARYPEFQLYFDVNARDITSGEVLSGRLGNATSGFVSLLLIDDEGVVQDLGSFLKFSAGSARFDIPMTLKGSPVETHQLLMALSTRSRLNTLKSLSGQPAKDFFQRLAVEILLQGGGEDVALVAFSVR
ncbi:MAG: hypothetical protein ABJN34_17680 [Litoreibacter sp.]|uniref:hypothetical protein n=1 Tax=Litoreibacter sp. TaxID=1969459 RepID=UPI00329A7BCB